MIQQGFSIGERDWYIMVQYDIYTTKDLNEVYKTLLASGCADYKAQEACMVLSRRNTGYTFTNFNDHLSVIFIGKADSPEQVYDTLQHETKHVVEHIGEYYGIMPNSEESAYLQGEVARQMFPAAAMVVCPKCHKE